MAETKFKTIVQVGSNTYNNCEVCRFQTPHLGDIPVMMNHYLRAHGFEVLHVGQETERNDEGLCHSTVALLGCETEFPKRVPGQLALPEKEKLDG